MINSPVSAQSAPNPSPKSKLKPFLLILFLLLILLPIAIWHFGSQQKHTQNKHPLFSSFDDSPQHKKLLTDLAKNKYSILIGKKTQGLFHFVKHYANTLSRKNRTIFLEEYSKDHFEYYQIIRNAKKEITQLLGQEIINGDLILQSTQGDAIPLEIITSFQEQSQLSRILIVSLTPLKIKGFKQFKFKGIDAKLLQKSISKTFKIKPHVSNILSDYYQTHQDIYTNLDVEKIDQKTLLGEHHIPLQGLEKQSKIFLQTLCSKGKSKSKKQDAKLIPFGIIHYKGENYWQNHEKILNYELKTGVNCKNTIATESVLKDLQAHRQKLEQQRKAKEEIERKKNEEAELKRIEEQAKKKEQQEKKKEASNAAKVSKPEKSTPKSKSKGGSSKK